MRHHKIISISVFVFQHSCVAVLLNSFLVPTRYTAFAQNDEYFDMMDAETNDDDRHPINIPRSDETNPLVTQRPSSYPTSVPSWIPSSWPISFPSISPSSTPSLTPITSPSISPSSSPSSTINCTMNKNGDLGNTISSNGKLGEVYILFKYDVELNMTLINVTLDRNNERVEQEVVPVIESKLLSLIIPKLFQQCNDTKGDSGSSFSIIQGMSSQPKDVVDDSECNIQTTIPGSSCFQIKAGFSVYYESSEGRRSEENSDEIKTMIALLHENIKILMDEEFWNDVHIAIENCTYVGDWRLPNNVNEGKSPYPNEIKETSPVSIYVIVGTILVIIVVVSVIVSWKKRKPDLHECDVINDFQTNGSIEETGSINFQTNGSIEETGSMNEVDNSKVPTTFEIFVILNIFHSFNPF